MKASNIVISTAAAISMAGVLGLAYAQSTYTDPQTGTAGTMNRDGTTGTTSQTPSDTPSQDSTRTMNQDSTGSTGTTRSGDMHSERVARADRN